MLKTTYLDQRNIKERELTFKELSDSIESYFLLADKVKSVNIQVEFSVSNGVAATFNNKVNIENLYNCFKKYNGNILIEFEEFKNVFTINEKANVRLDFINDRLHLLDHNITIYFN